MTVRKNTESEDMKLAARIIANSLESEGRVTASALMRVRRLCSDHGPECGIQTALQWRSIVEHLQSIIITED